MNIFRKVSRGSSNLFTKGEKLGKNIFNKVDDIKDKAPEVLDKISKGADKASGVLDKISKISGKVASNPLTQALPGGSLISSVAGGISSASKYGAQGSKNISELSDLSRYKKGGINKQLENVRDIQNRGKELQKNAENLGRAVIG